VFGLPTTFINMRLTRQIWPECVTAQQTAQAGMYTTGKHDAARYRVPSHHPTVASPPQS